MLSQVSSTKNKKGVSIMVSYVILITIAIIMGVVVYQWIKTYVPAEALNCPEGVSVFLKDYFYDCDSDTLNITLKNNGRFNIAGYFIYARDNQNEELATIDLSEYNEREKIGNAISLGNPLSNSFEPSDNPVTHVFDLSSFDRIYSIDIIPVRYQEEEGKQKFVNCGDARIKDKIDCSEREVECGDGICNSSECASGCTDDCSLSNCCGDRTCNVAIGETYENCPGDCPQEIIQLNYFGFESGEQGWTDPGDDSERSDDRSIFDDDEEEGGDYSWHIQDDISTSYTSRDFDFTGYSEIIIEFYYYPSSIDEEEYVQLKCEGNEIWKFTEGDHAQDNWLFGEVNITSSNCDFTSTTELRFTGNPGLSGDQDEFYVDGIEVSGIK